MLEPVENQYEKIGYIARTHGVQGEVLMLSDIDAPTLFDSLDLVHLENARGDLIPARIESVRVQKKNNRLSFFVKFEHVADRTQAETLKHFAVFVERERIQDLLDREDVPVDLTGFEIWAGDRLIGLVQEVIENPAHPILQVDHSGKGPRLIPCAEEYISGIDEEARKIQCRNLDQLEGL